MFSKTIALAATLRLLLGTANAAPTASAQVETSGFIAAGPGSSTFWMSNIQRQGAVAFGNDTSYKVFRNVQTDCGAKGDGSTDDTAALNACISMGDRCGLGCDSTTVTPALLFFPAGTYSKYSCGSRNAKTHTNML